MIGWDETVPADTESAGLGDDRVRSLKTSLRQGLDDEHIWPSTGGDVGMHRRGSAKAYVGVQSTVSSSGTEGKLMLTSDTSRLFTVGSGGTNLIGGSNVIQAGEFPGVLAPQRHYWVDEFGQAVTGSSGSVLVTFPRSGFSGVPFTVATVVATVAGLAGVGVQVTPIDGATFIASTLGGAFSPAVTVNWFSRGTRVL